MTINIAVMGLKHGASFLEELDKGPEFDLKAVVDLDNQLAQKLSHQFNIHAYASLDQLRMEEKIDAIVLALPTPLHAQMSIACLEAGYHVLQEKPLCRSDEEARSIRDAVRSSDRVFQVGYEVRSSPLHRSIMDNLRDGLLGEVTSVWWHQHCWDKSNGDDWRMKRENMGGKFFDCAVHYFDIVRLWAGAPIHRLCALGNALGQTGVCENELPESVTVALEYQNGVRGTFNFGSRNRFNDDASFGVAGTTGRIMGNPIDAGSYELRTDRGVKVSEVNFDPKLTSGGHLGFGEEIDNFARSIAEGAPIVCSIDDAIEIHVTMRMLDRSLATGQTVSAEEFIV